MAKKIKTSNIGNENEMLKIFKLVAIVCLVSLVFYLITVFINKDDKKESDTKTPATIQYDYILVGDILSKENDSYYVLAKMSNDLNTKAYEAYLSNYKSVKDAKRVYYVDLNNPFNEKAISTKSKFNTTDALKVRFNETTLLLIQKGKIIKTYEGKDKITEILQEITKTDKD